MTRVYVLTVALLLSLSLSSGALRKQIHQPSSQNKNTSSVVLAAESESSSEGTPASDPDTVEQGPDGDGNVEG
jgi:hypothetical protein